MAKVVLVCSDESERTLLEACLKGNEVAGTKTFKDAAKALTQDEPSLVVVRVDHKDPAGMEALRLMKRSQIHAPTVVVLPRQAGSLENEARQLGVQVFLSSPIRYDDFCKATDKARSQARKNSQDNMPAITESEHRANLSELIKGLHKAMKCPAGSNRVFIRSVVKGLNDKSEPRISLRCPIRQAVGLDEYVYYEYIQTYCCGHPKTCDAVIQYKALRKTSG